MAGLVRLCPSVCVSSHFAVLLGAYGASLSTLGELWGPGCGTPESVGTKGWDPGTWGVGGVTWACGDPGGVTWGCRDQGVCLWGMGTSRCGQDYMGGLKGCHQQAF